MDQRMFGGDMALMRSVIKYALADAFNNGVRAAMAVAREARSSEPAHMVANRMSALLKNPRAEADGVAEKKEAAEIEAQTMEKNWLAQACAPWFAMSSSDDARGALSAAPKE